MPSALPHGFSFSASQRFSFSSNAPRSLSLIARCEQAFIRLAPSQAAHPWQLSYFVTAVLLLLAVASWLASEKLYETELKGMRDQSRLLHELEAQTPAQRDSLLAKPLISMRSSAPIERAVLRDLVLFVRATITRPLAS